MNAFQTLIHEHASQRVGAVALKAIADAAITKGFPVRRISPAEAVEYDLAGVGVDPTKSAVQKAIAARRGARRAAMVAKAKKTKGAA